MLEVLPKVSSLTQREFPQKRTTVALALPYLIVCKTAASAIIKETVTLRMYVSLYTIAQHTKLKTNQSIHLCQNINLKLAVVF